MKRFALIFALLGIPAFLGAMDDPEQDQQSEVRLPLPWSHSSFSAINDLQRDLQPYADNRLIQLRLAKSLTLNGIKISAHFDPKEKNIKVKYFDNVRARKLSTESVPVWSYFTSVRDIKLAYDHVNNDLLIAGIGRDDANDLEAVMISDFVNLRIIGSFMSLAALSKLYTTHETKKSFIDGKKRKKRQYVIDVAYRDRTNVIETKRLYLGELEEKSCLGQSIPIPKAAL